MANLAGYMDEIGIDGYGVLVDALLENTPELVWPLSVRTFSQMRHDPQLTPILTLYTEAICGTPWMLDGEGCRDEVVQQIADDLGLPIKGVEQKPTGARRRGFTWAEHLRTSLLDQTFGHMFFEQNWDEIDGKFRLGLVQERMPQTISAIHLNESDGTLKSVEQNRRASEKDAPKITTADHRLVYYVRNREGANYFGQSLLRPAYGPWLIKGQILRVHATSIRRFGMGVPEVQAPAGATPQQIAEAQRIAGNIRAGEHSGVGLPNGFTLNLRGMNGSVPDAVEFLNYLDRQMTRQALASILDMATAERGARSLGDTILNVLMLALQSTATHHANVGTQQIVIPLVDANWGASEPAPQIVCGDVGEQREISPQEINWLVQWGALTAGDPGLEDWLRHRYQIPAIDAAYRKTPEQLANNTKPTTP